MRNAILIGVSWAPDFGSLQLLPTKTALLGCLLTLLVHLVVLLLRHLLLLLRHLFLLLRHLFLLLRYLFAVLSLEARVGLRVFDGA